MAGFSILNCDFCYGLQLINRKMGSQERKKVNKPSKYQQITRERRLELIRLILEEGESIKNAAQKMGVSSSTARVIVRTYEEKGTIFQSKSSTKKRLLNQNQGNALIPQSQPQNNNNFYSMIPCTMNPCQQFYSSVPVFNPFFSFN